MKRICRRKFLLTPSLARRVGFRRNEVFPRNRVTLHGHNPIYELAALKSGIPIGYVHRDISLHFAPIASANCYWLWRLARRAIARADMALAKSATRDALPEMRRNQPSRQRTDEARQRARDRYQRHIDEERARARAKMSIKRATLKILRRFEAQPG